MTNLEKLNLEIDKQINAGFEPSEIRSNLLLQHFTDSEVTAAFKQRNMSAASPGKSQSQTSVASLLVSIFFIISGFWRMSSNSSGSGLYTWGLILVLVGVAGTIWKGIELAKR